MKRVMMGMVLVCLVFCVFSGNAFAEGKYNWTLINVDANNYFDYPFPGDYTPENSIDDNPTNEWLNAIDDLLPTSIWYEFPNVETISKVGTWQTKLHRRRWTLVL